MTKISKFLVLAALMVFAATVNAGIILNFGTTGETEIQGDYTLDTGELYWNVIVSGDSILTINNATVNGLAVTDQSQVFVNGGELQDRVSVRDDASATIYANSFIVDSQVVTSMEVTQISENNPFQDNITVFPEGGNSYSSSFTVENSGKLVLSPVPEPVSITLLGIGCLFLKKHKS